MRLRCRLIPLVVLALAASGAALYTPDRERAALEARYLAAPTDLRVVDGVRLHVRDEGPRDAEAVVLLHGLGASLHTWDPWAAALARDRRVIRLDLPGHGLTGPSPDGDYTDVRAHRLLAALLDSLRLGRVTVVGHSMGGRLAWSFAAERPERVARLVLIAPDGFASPGFEYDRPADVPAALGLMRWVLPAPLLRANLAPAYADPDRITEETFRRYQDLLLAPGNREAMLTRLRQTVLTDPAPRLARITAPTLVLWGEADGMIPVRNADDYARRMPHATVVRLPGLGHVPFEEAPAVALGPVRAFLDGEPTSQTSRIGPG
jgi:pimeloyl-ACP methyl ester carboxylesterase